MARKKLRSTINAEWIEEHCRVPEGKLVGKPFKLHKTQSQILKGIYDSPTRTVIISWGRKNGKTTFSAMLLLLHLVGPEAEKRPNSQLFSTALSREQAAIIFKLASKVVRMSPTLSNYVTVRESAKSLVCHDLGTVYTALSSEASTAHGSSPVFVVHDELGRVKGPRSELFEAVETGTGAHEDPLSIIISTQAEEDSDLLSELIDDAEKSNDPKIKLFLWTAPEDDDPWSEVTWKKANPLYGHALQPARVKEQAATAKRMPSREASFRNLILNQRVAHSDTFIGRSAWVACNGDVDLEVFRKRVVWLGVDLSARNDLTAIAMVAEDSDRVWHVLCEFFAPEKNVVERAKRDRVPYDQWAKDGWITLTPGASVDYEIVAKRLIEICDLYDVAGVAFDRWRIDVLEKELERLKVELPLAPFGQGFKDMSPALDTVEAVLTDERIRHGGNPVLTWCASNAVAVSDPAGNRKLDKKKSTGRIDGIIGVTMAMGVAQSAPEQKPVGQSIYNQGML